MRTAAAAVTKTKLPLDIALIAWFVISAWALTIPFDGFAFEIASRGRYPLFQIATLLVMFGKAIGRSVYLKLEESNHYTNLFAALVGPNSSERKGQSVSMPRRLFCWRTSTGPDCSKTRSRKRSVRSAIDRARRPVTYGEIIVEIDDFYSDHRMRQFNIGTAITIGMMRLNKFSEAEIEQMKGFLLASPEEQQKMLQPGYKAMGSKQPLCELAPAGSHQERPSQSTCY